VYASALATAKMIIHFHHHSKFHIFSINFFSNRLLKINFLLFYGDFFSGKANSLIQDWFFKPMGQTLKLKNLS